MSAHDTEALLRSAMEQELEDVMTTVDVERELAAFQAQQRRQTGRRRTALAVAASVAVLAGAGGGYALLAADEAPGADRVLAPRALEDGALTSYALPGAPSPRWVDVLDGRVVVGSPTALTVLNAEDGSVVSQLEGPLYGNTVRAQDGSVWTTYEDDSGPAYARVDLARGTVLALARTGSGYYLAAGGAGLWGVADGQAVAEIDPATGEVLRTVELPFRPFGIAATDDALWAQSARGGQLARVDAETGAVSAGPTLRGSAPLVAHAGDVWVVEPETASLVRLDGSTGDVLSRTALPGTPPLPETRARMSVAAADGEVVVTSADGSMRLLTRVDAQDGSVVDVVELGAGPAVVVGAGDGAVWFAGGEAKVRRLALDG